MENENKSAWGKILKVIITVLTAVATTLLIYNNMLFFYKKIRDIPLRYIP